MLFGRRGRRGGLERANGQSGQGNEKRERKMLCEEEFKASWHPSWHPRFVQQVQVRSYAPRSKLRVLFVYLCFVPSSFSPRYFYRLLSFPGFSEVARGVVRKPCSSTTNTDLVVDVLLLGVSFFFFALLRRWSGI